MKKIFFLIAMFLIAFITIRCKEDADIPALKFDIDVKTDATISEKGINDESVIKFDMKTDYDYAAAPLSYKIDYSGIGILKLAGEEMNKDTTYKLDKPELILSYIGKEAGNHTIKVHFFNDKGVNVLKSVEIPYVKYNFAVEVTGDTSPYQGETKEYKLKITPENTTIKDSYKIKFISYDENDVALQKSYAAFNGTKIQFNKEYEIKDLSSEQLITLKSFNAGAKTLVYTIINSSSEKQDKIAQTVKQSQVEVKNLAFNKLLTSTLDDNLQVRGFIEKTPALTKYVQYKSWIVDVPNEQKDGIENTDNTYKEYILPDNNEIVLNVKAKKYGTYKYMIQFKDEFGTETTPYSFEIKVTDKNFEIEQKLNTNLENVVQGQDIDITFEIKEADAKINETYQVQFLSFDPSDESLLKSKIYLNGSEIQLNKWYPVNKGGNNQIKLNSFNSGSKKIKYQVKNSMYSKENIIDINIKRANISLKNLLLKTNKVFINEQFVIEGNVEKTYSNEKNIEYKTWLSSGNASQFKELTNGYKKFSFRDSNNILSLEFITTNVGNYTLKIQAKDEFGNESEIKEFPIVVNYRTFTIEQVDDVLTNKFQGQDISFISSIKKTDADNQLNSKYKIKFLEFDPQDINLQKSYIKLNGNIIKLNVETDFKMTNNNIVVNSFHHGNVRLLYEVWNTETPNFKVKKETIINVKQATISADLRIEKTKIIAETDFSIQGKINTLSREGKIYYKSWVKMVDKRNTDIDWIDMWGTFPDIPTKNITSTNEVWKEKILAENDFSITENTNDQDGKYIYYLQLKDEFGNESKVFRYEVEVIPPISIKELFIELSVKQNLLADNTWSWRLRLNAESTNINSKLSIADVYIKTKTYSIERAGKYYSVTLKGYAREQWSFDLGNRLNYDEIRPPRNTDACLVVSWNIPERDELTINSIKSELIEKFKNDYFDVYIKNDKGQFVLRKVPITNPERLK